MKSFPIRQFPDDLHERMREFSFTSRVSMNKMFQYAMEYYLDSVVDGKICPDCGRPLHKYHNCELNPTAKPK